LSEHIRKVFFTVSIWFRDEILLDETFFFIGTITEMILVEEKLAIIISFPDIKTSTVFSVSA